MKKTISILIFLTLLVTVCLAIYGCSSSSNDKDDEISYQTSDTNGGIMVLPGVESGIFKKRFLYIAPEATEESINSEKTEVIKIGNREFIVYHIKTVCNGDKSITNVYCSDDERFEYLINQTKNSFIITAYNNAVLQEYGSDIVTEEKLLLRIKEYIADLIPNDNLERYTATCSTRVVVQNLDSAWAESKECFYMAENENETVESYVFDFCVYNQGMSTSDSITIRCNEKGDIKSIKYLNNGVDWSLVKIDADNIRDRAIAFAETAVSDEYTVKNVLVLSQTLTVYDSTIRVFAKCELYLEHNGVEIVVLCPLIINP